LKILGIETSCDETAAAVVADETEILSSVVSSQIDLHAPFGGVVPEIASRAHAEHLHPVIRRALEEAKVDWLDLDAVAVTIGPGLVGALLVGLSTAKALAWARDLPLVGVDHLEAHVHSIRMENPSIPYPHIALVVSGGHTRLYRCLEPGRAEVLGDTLDDAAGEAFDKVSALLGLGYPGGPAIERIAVRGDRRAFDLPRARLGDRRFDFSFSGLKTAVLYTVRGQNGTGKPRPEIEPADIAASFQEAVVDVLVHKTLGAARTFEARAIGVAGGVACNLRLREAIAAGAAEIGLEATFPRRALCTDNAAMIAGLGGVRWREGARIGLDAEVVA
jgi:N6-L-threonylcarbamoyladenine synthase